VRVHNWFDRYGRWTLFFGYFFAGVRHFTALVAGASKMEIPQFAIYAYSGALVWVVSFLAIGYFVGDQWKRWEPYLHKGALIATVFLIAGGVIVYLLRRRRV
jgi:membrane protein DedA with SNARE-associated domain